jgi:hypothetical protein
MAENLTWIAKIYRIILCTVENSTSKDRNPAGAGLYFPVHPSGHIHIASQSERKNPIRNPARLCLNFQPCRVYWKALIIYF